MKIIQVNFFKRVKIAFFGLESVFYIEKTNEKIVISIKAHDLLSLSNGLMKKEKKN
jgi:hypothetical protein